MDTNIGVLDRELEFERRFAPDRSHHTETVNISKRVCGIKKKK